MSVRHGFLLSVICLLYSSTCCPTVFEPNEQFAKGNISQLAVTKIDLNGYKTDVSTFQAKDWKDFVMEFCICIREWKVVPRVLGNEELLELTPAVNGSLFKSAWNFLVMERNHHENISFVLFRAWHGTIDSGLFTKWLKLRYSKTRIAYYSNYMANQALLLSGDVEKIPDLARERRQALIIIYYPGRNQQRQGAITVRKQLGETKRTFHVPIVWDVFT